MVSRPRTLRVPDTANARILGDPFLIQTNHCRTPDCANFGVPARTAPGKRGPSKDRDLHYTLTSTAKGQEPAIECKACNGKGAVRSNAAIAEEIERIAGYARALEYRFACKTEGCANEGLSIGEHRERYRRHGHYNTPENPYYQCKECLKRVLVSRKVPRIRDGNRALAADVFSRVANKSPMRRTVAGAGLSGNSAYYRILDFIHRRCREMNGAFTRSFLTGERRLPAAMNVAIDSQSLMVNWPSKVQRRTVEMTSCCSVDSASRFILELDVNHDPRFEPFEVNRESAERDDLTRKEAFRRYARFWLAGDEMHAGRSAQRQMGRAAANRAVGAIQDAFRAANAYADVAEMEIVPGHGPLRDTMLRNGMLVKTGYRTLGHMFVLRELLKGAGVERLQLCMDEHLSTISAFMCAFQAQIAGGRAHGFLVRYDKDCPIDDREELYKAAHQRMRAFARARNLQGLDREDIGIEMIREIAEHRRPARKRLAPASAAHAAGAQQGGALDHAGPGDGSRRAGPALFRRLARPGRQCLRTDPPVPVVPGAALLYAERRLEPGLVRLRSLQPGHGAEISRHLPGGEQLHPHRQQGWRDARHAARLRRPTALLCRYSLAGREDPPAPAQPPQGARAQALKGRGGMRRTVSVPDAAQAAAGLQQPPVGPRLPEG